MFRDLLPLLFFLVCGITAEDDLTICDNKFSYLNGRCSSYAPFWHAGEARQVLKSAPLAPPIDAEPISHSPPTVVMNDMFTDWMAAWVSTISKDVMRFRLMEFPELVNQETPVLDLSILYGTDDSKNVRPRWKSIAESDWDSLKLPRSILLSLFGAEHKRIKQELAMINPTWHQRELEKTARKIVIAEYQHIIQSEVMPLLMPDNFVQSIVNTGNVSLNRADIIALHADLAFQPSPHLSRFFDKDTQLAHSWDASYVDLLNRPLTMGIGDPTLSRAVDTKFVAELMKMVHNDDSTSIDECFAHLGGSRDLSVSPLIAAFLDTPDPTEVFGGALQCLIAQTWKKVIGMDRFWFDKPTAKFSQGQLSAIKATSLASIICQNMNSAEAAGRHFAPKVGGLSGGIKVQPDVFVLPGHSLNALTDCNAYAKLDLTQWKDNSQVKYLKHDATKVLSFTKQMIDIFKTHFFLTPALPIDLEAKSSMEARIIRDHQIVGHTLEKATQHLLDIMLDNDDQDHQDEKCTDCAEVPRRTKRSVGSFSKSTIGTEQRGNLFPIDPSSNVQPLGAPSSPLPVGPPAAVDLDANDQNENRQTFRGRFLDVKLTTGASYPKVDLQYFTKLEPNAPSVIYNFGSDYQITSVGRCTSDKESLECPTSGSPRYRTFNGWCNNLQHPIWGKSNTIMPRIGTSAYSDGVATPRFYSRQLTKTGGLIELPNPRQVSMEVHTSEMNLDNKFTLMLMQWGQILDHDVVHTPFVREKDGKALNCKHCHSFEKNPACFPIPIPKEDVAFPNSYCIPFTRSNAGEDVGGVRSQINQVTSFIDGSMVYGSDECAASQLRDPENRHQLLTTRHLVHGRVNGLGLMPMSDKLEDCFSTTGRCFRAGDARANEQPGLAVMHTLLLREHNALASRLASLNPHWDDEKVFQEARRIVAAQIQHITYNEFLPRVLGKRRMQKYGLEILPTGYFHGYSKTCNPQIFNEFATAAFRFGHSMIRPNFTMLTNDDMVVMSRSRSHDLHAMGKNIPLRHHFNNPDLIMRENTIGDLTRGLVMMPMEAVDDKITFEVTEHLFEENTKKRNFVAMDLVALNIHRGRDHGIEGYNAYRPGADLPRAANFDDLKDAIPYDVVEKFKKIYNHPDDIDLFPGLLSEFKVDSSLTGQTLGHILGTQFSNLRKCDRYWFETADPDIRFTEAQLDEIRKSSLASLVCRNQDDQMLLTRNVMDQMSETNPVVDCELIRKLDLVHWKEVETDERVCKMGEKTLKLGEDLRVSPCSLCSCSSKGLKCEKVKVRSCATLIYEFGYSAVENDQSCRPQCQLGQR